MMTCNISTINFVLRVNAPSLKWIPYISLFFNNAEMYLKNIPWWTLLIPKKVEDLNYVYGY